jgi:hypothetical protein
LSSRTIVWLLGGGLLAIGASACESTQSESAEVAKHAKAAAKQQMLHLGAVSRDVHVSDVTLLRSAEKDAVAAKLTNTSRHAIADAPILVEVLGGDRKALYTNATGGLEPALQHIPLLAGHASEWWVDDQVVLDGKPQRVSVRVGSARKSITGAPRSISVNGVHLGEQDGLWVLSGSLSTTTARSLRGVSVFAVGIAGGRVKAAGRAIISSVHADASGVPFQIFLVGSSAGVTFTTSAAPSA